MSVTSPTPPPEQPQFTTPQPAPGYGAPYSPQPWPYQGPPAAAGRPAKKGMPTWAIVLLVIAGLMVVACIGGVALLGLGAKGISDANDAAKKDVTLSACKDGGEFVGPTATVDVTNHGSRKASYSVTVEFVSSDGGTQLGTGIALINDLAAGQTAHEDAVAFKANSTGGNFTCRVTKVTKY